MHIFVLTSFLKIAFRINGVCLLLTSDRSWRPSGYFL